MGRQWSEIWGVNKISIYKNLSEEGRIDIGITKTDKMSLGSQKNVEITRIKMRVIDKERLGFGFEDITANDVEGKEVKVKGIPLEKGISNYVGNAPTEYQLSNYPNPFNPTTRIRIGLPEATEVSLVIYNALGQEMTRLSNRTMLEAGVYDYEWDASNVPSGIYFYNIKTNNYSLTKKMILVK